MESKVCIFIHRLDASDKTRYNPGMELVQLKNLFAELKKKATDLRGFL